MGVLASTSTGCCCGEARSKADVVGSSATSLTANDESADKIWTAPPYRRAAISSADNGLDFRRSFCRLFWNQIYRQRSAVS